MNFKSKVAMTVLTAILASVTTFSALAADSKVGSWPMEVPEVPTKYDWLLTKKGEILAGELVSMYQDTVEFDSEEAGLLKIDLEDVRQIRTKNVMSIRQDDNTVLDGQLIITQDTVHFADQPGVKIPRSMLLSIAPSEKSDQGLWDGDLSIGLNFKSGNSERFDYTAQLNARRLTSTDRILFSYTGLFSEVEDPDTEENVKTEENHRILASYDWFYSRKVFFRMPQVEYYTDEFKNIANQATIGVAAGYLIADESGFKWDVFAGPSVQYTEFEQVAVGEDEDDTSPVIILGTHYERDITNDIEFYFDYRAKFVSEESGSVVHNLETGIEIEVIKDFDIELKTIIDHVKEPIADENDEIPEKTDVLFVVGLKYSF
ncbi:YdiY family protein [Thalassotalea crassostreae]|uniref:DUF481 domain-containing protein n=1 Tax=Thalassotalea crassostreae TaxID=1763536 RepID=UPI000838EB48|nr:DUF481 domain-containing protein [Thalassotalea crassostreae]